MNRCIIIVLWLVGLPVLLVSRPAAAQSQPAQVKATLPNNLTQDTVRLYHLADCLSALNIITNDFDDNVEDLFHKGVAIYVFEQQHGKADTLMGQTQNELNAIEKQCTGSLSKLVRPQVRDCIEALRSYRGASQALINGNSKPSGFKKSQYSRATSYLLQSVSNCLQAIQQVRAEQQVKAHMAESINNASKQSRLRIDSLKTFTLLLHRLDSVRFDTLTNIGRRVESALHPYQLPRFMVLAGTYQANAYSLGALRYKDGGKWAATGSFRYDASTKRGGVEVAFGYRAQAFGLLAGPTLQVAPAQLGWKVQSLLLKTGLTLGVAYDSRLGPGILAAFGLK